MASCKKKNEHLLPSSILFFKIILRTNLERGQLNIPNKFTRKYSGGLPNPVFLKSPDGAEWKVHWTKRDGGIWFEKGWKEFVTNYSLDHGHMVLFDYKESSHFDVHIFDKSTLEIDYPFQSSQDEILDEPPPRQKTRQKSCPRPRKKLKTGKCGDVGRSSNLPSMSQHFQWEENMVDDAECIKVEQEELTSKIAEALKRAKTIKSKTTNSSFIVVMKPSYVNGKFLYVPSKFAEKHLKGKEGDTFLLVLEGKTWPTKYLFSKFSTGWQKFVLDNHLNVGDVCLFELTNSLSLKASIFRVSEESQFPPPSQVEGDEVDRKETEPVKFSNVESTGGKKTERASLLMSTSTSRCSFANEALKRAKEFASENPFFTVSIRPDKEKDRRPSVPAPFVRKYLNDKRSVTLKFGNKLWSVKLLYSQNGKVSKFSCGWALFAKERNLVGGDVCVFELINREHAVLRVCIFRADI